MVLEKWLNRSFSFSLVCFSVLETGVVASCLWKSPTVRGSSSIFSRIVMILCNAVVLWGVMFRRGV